MIDFTKIRMAQEGDADEIALLFKLVTDNMLLKGIMQWHYNYPIHADIYRDIIQKTCYVFVIDSKIAGTITLDSNQDEQYKNVEWSFLTNKCLVIHRLGVHPDFQGQSIAKKLCHYAEHIAIQKNIKHIRLDAYSQNNVSNNLYHSLGYKRAKGACYFHGNEAPFYCYEKYLGE